MHHNNFEKMAGVLAEAFCSDPLFQYFFPDVSTRQRCSFYTFRFIVAHALKKGCVIETSEALEGVAVWLLSENLHRSLHDQIRFGVLRMLLQQGTAAIGRQKMVSGHMQSLHAQLLPVPHLYLSSIGITANHRGKGLASPLILPMLKEADVAHLLCYLDAHNIALYERFGFCVANESVIPHSNVRHWAMIRQSQ